MDEIVFINNEEYRRLGIMNYYVSENGNVANIIVKDGFLSFFKQLKLEETWCGHYRVPLKYEKGKERKYSVHRLVYQTFVGELKTGFVIDHIDANPKNNHYSNLRQVTQKENVENAIAHGNFGHNHDTKIVVFDKITNEEKVYNSIKEFYIKIGAPKYMIDHGGLSCLKKRVDYRERYVVKKIDKG